MKTRPISEAIDLTVRQHVDYARQQGQPAPDPVKLRTQVQQALVTQDQKQNR